MKTGRTARWSAGDGSAGEVCRGRLRSKAKRRPKDDWSLAGQAIPTSSWRAKGHLGVGKIALRWMDGPGRLILELTGLMWWMKPASRCLVSLHTKKMKVGNQTFFFSGSCQAPGRTAGAFLQGPADLPAPRSPAPWSSAILFLRSPGPPHWPIATPPTCPGSTACRDPASRPFPCIPHRQLYRSSTLKSGNRAKKKKNR